MNSALRSSRLVLLGACGCLGGIAPAHSAASPVEATFERLVSVCGEMNDASARVACFDREIAPFRVRSARSPSDAAPPVVSAPATNAAPARSPPPLRVAAPPIASPPLPSSRDLGAEELARPSSRAAKVEDTALTARITAIRSVDATASIVTLDNGQVWRNEDPRRSGFLKEGAAVTIRKGSFGSYRLTLDGGDSRNWISVIRVR